ncbi:MAG: DNA topoisomerase [Eubacterium ventriosum]
MKWKVNILHLICSRLHGCHCRCKRHDSIHVETEINGIEFEANGTHTIDRGFTQMEIMLGITKECADKELNEASVGETMTINLKEIAEVKIKPPALYTDASLLAAMETAGNDVYDNETEKKE